MDELVKAARAILEDFDLYGQPISLRLLADLRRAVEAAQQGVHLTVLPVREIETVCPHCSLVFDVPVPEPHSK